MRSGEWGVKEPLARRIELRVESGELRVELMCRWRGDSTYGFSDEIGNAHSWLP